MLGLNFGFGDLEVEFWRWAFLMTRIGAALVAAPFFGTGNVPPQVRVIMAGAIALLVANSTKVAAPADLMSMSGYLAIIGEVAIGTMLGFVLQLSFATPAIAAELIGGGMGLSLAATVDPNSGARSPILGQYFAVVLTLIFLGLGAHLQWLALVVKSYEAFPPGHVLGSAVMSAPRLGVVLSFASTMFATAVMMALPVTLTLLLVQILAGLLSRSAPALNLFSLGLPAGIVAGLAALLATAPMISDRMTELSATAIEQVSQAMGG
jgi:flagellar biosynthetic protein FliR